MKIETGIPDLNWDKQLINFNGHFLQSQFWASFQQKLKRKTYYCQSDSYMWLGVGLQNRFSRYLYIPYGPTIKDLSEFSLMLEEIKSFAQSQKLDFIKFEPRGSNINEVLLKKYAFRSKENQPQWTNVLDLSQSEEELLKNLSSGHRYSINHAKTRSIEIKEVGSEDLPIFLKMQSETAARANIKSFPDTYFHTLFDTLPDKKNIKMFVAQVKNDPIASTIVFDWSGTRYYAFAAAYQQLNRKLQAASVLVWEMIKDAKKQDYKYFDFWGVAPKDDENHKWLGLSYFKRAFGGKDVQYSGTWDIPIKKFKYQIISKLNN